jgi:hypothetical protein
MASRLTVGGLIVPKRPYGMSASWVKRCWSLLQALRLALPLVAKCWAYWAKLEWARTYNDLRSSLCHNSIHTFDEALRVRSELSGVTLILLVLIRLIVPFQLLQPGFPLCFHVVAHDVHHWTIGR